MRPAAAAVVARRTEAAGGFGGVPRCGKGRDLRAFCGPEGKSPAEPYNRLDMLSLKAECQLQLRQTTAALDALDAAQREAANGASRGGCQHGLIGVCLSHSAFSHAQHYTPKTSNGPLAKKPIDILDRGQRPDAYKALFADELAAAQQKIRQAETARTMPPILEGAKNAPGGCRHQKKRRPGTPRRRWS